jgi:1-phosphofructokinase family hexose kinase
MGLILTLTLNPAVDRNIMADRLVFEDRAYILSTNETAGGRGINASRVVHSFGAPTKAIACSGGKSGKRFEELLRGAGFAVHVVKIRNEIRNNITIVDKQGLAVKLNETGPHIQIPELRKVEKALRDNLSGAAWLMLCGSLPPGVPTDFYARLIRLAHKVGVKTLLDTDGDALLHGLEAGPTAVAPNQAEAVAEPGADHEGAFFRSRLADCGDGGAVGGAVTGESRGGSGEWGSAVRRDSAGDRCGLPDWGGGCTGGDVYLGVAAREEV